MRVWLDGGAVALALVALIFAMLWLVDRFAPDALLGDECIFWHRWRVLTFTYHAHPGGPRYVILSVRQRCERCGKLKVVLEDMPAAFAREHFPSPSAAQTTETKR